jgi:hypothetical protein
MEDAEISRLLQNMPPPIDVSEIIREQLAASEEMNSVPNSYENAEGLWARRSPIEKAEQIVVPHPVRESVLNLAHNSVTAGHPGCSALKLSEC